MEEFRGLVQFMERFDTEEKCREHLRSILYPQNPTCKCGCKRMYYFERRSFFGFRCHKCGFAKALSHNTMFKQSKLGLRKWFIAIYLFTVHDQGLTSVKLAELLDINKGSAWHLLHRIRKSLHHTNLNKKLCGIVEADETYIGGKKKGKTGRGSQNKKIVFGTIQRQGRVYAKVVANCGKQVLQPIIHKKVRKTTKIFTDYWAGYRNLEGYKHIRIKHNIRMECNSPLQSKDFGGM
jgi:transposase-like protein